MDKNTRFCKVENGKIAKYNVAQNRTGLGVNSPKETYIENGWYEVVDNRPAIDTATHRFSGSTYEVGVNVVTKTYTVVEIPTEELVTKKVAEGEMFVNGLITSRLSEFNKEHGTVFNKVNDMGIYIVDDTYPLKAECIELTKWNNLLWATTRAKQADVLSGVLSEEDFKALLEAI